MGKPCAEHVVRITRQMNSGYAATYVRDGSMGSALRLLLLGQSTSSSTNARPVRTREPGLNVLMIAAAWMLLADCNPPIARKASVLFIWNS